MLHNKRDWPIGARAPQGFYPRACTRAAAFSSQSFQAKQLFTVKAFATSNWGSNRTRDRMLEIGIS